MELHQLQYFVNAAETQHFTRASELSFITQSSLSQQIKKLEDELGMLLFNRRGKQVQLTEAGKIFLKHARQILAKVEAGKQAIENLSNLIGGELRVGVTYIFSGMILPALKSFARQYPDLKIIVEYGTTELLERKLLNDELDLVLAFYSGDNGLPVERTALFSSRMVMAVSVTNPLATLDKLSFKKLMNYTLVLPNREFNSREFLDELFLLHKMQPKIAMELSDIHSLLTLVADSNWVTIVNEKALAGWTNLKAIKLTGIDTARESYLLTASDVYQKKATRLFIDELKRLLQ